MTTNRRAAALAVGALALAACGGGGADSAQGDVVDCVRDSFESVTTPDEMFDGIFDAMLECTDG